MGCKLLPQREGVLEVDLTMILWQPRHIDQAAEAILDAAPVREEQIRPIRLLCDVGHGDILRKATHHKVRGVHANASHILGHRHLKSGRDCGPLTLLGTPISITIRMLSPERLEEQSALPDVQLLEELLRVFLPSREDATNLAHLEFRNCGAHKVFPRRRVVVSPFPTCNQTKPDRASSASIRVAYEQLTNQESVRASVDLRRPLQILDAARSPKGCTTLRPHPFPTRLLFVQQPHCFIHNA